jgi:predicted lipid-binding transport protein (Tim44 family)
MSAPVERFDALSAWFSMGIAARVILVVLIAFAGLLFFIVLERFRAYRRAERPAVAAAALRFDLHRRLHTLAAIKVTAPLLGLLGTLLGTINALAGMAITGVVNPHALGAGMAEALMMTVLGLVIGLPAWWAHSFFNAWSERILARAA